MIKRRIEFIKNQKSQNSLHAFIYIEREKNISRKLKIFCFFFFRILNMTSSFNNLNVPDVKRDPDLPIKNERLNGFAEEDTMSSSRSGELQCCLLDNGKRYVIIK